MDQKIARAVSTSMALQLCSLRVSRRECGAWCIFPPSALIVKLPQHSLAPSSKVIAGEWQGILIGSSYGLPLSSVGQPMGAAHYSAALLPCRSSPSCLTPDSCRLFNSTMSLTLFCFFLLPVHPPALRSTLQGLSSFPLPKWFASTAAGWVGVNRGLSASRLGSQVPSIVSATSRDAWAGVRRCGRLPVAKSSGAGLCGAGHLRYRLHLVAQAEVRKVSVPGAGRCSINVQCLISRARGVYRRKGPANDDQALRNVGSSIFAFDGI